jgi:Pentapeptide repeats (8 copies)
MRVLFDIVVLSLAFAVCFESSDAYLQVHHPSKNPETSSTARHALWRRVAPQRNHVNLVEDVPRPAAVSPFIVALLGLTLASPVAANAVSGGGLDYANIDITGQDFSKGNFKGKDFTQVIAKGTNFAGSNLQGCRFYKAFLVRVLRTLQKQSSHSMRAECFIPAISSSSVDGNLTLFFASI